MDYVRETINIGSDCFIIHSRCMLNKEVNAHLLLIDKESSIGDRLKCVQGHNPTIVLEEINGIKVHYGSMVDELYIEKLKVLIMHLIEGNYIKNGIKLFIDSIGGYRYCNLDNVDNEFVFENIE